MALVLFAVFKTISGAAQKLEMPSLWTLKLAGGKKRMLAIILVDKRRLVSK